MRSWVFTRSLNCKKMFSILSLLKNSTYNMHFKKSVLIIHCCEFVLLLMLACTSSKVSDPEITEIEINHPEWVDFKDLVEEVHCVTLEASAQSYLTDSWKVLSQEGYFYLWSLSDFSICIFDQSGKFIRRIDNATPGEGKIEMPSDILLNEKNQFSVIDSRKRIKTYSPSGDFLYQKELPSPVVKISFFGENSGIYYDGGFDRTSGYYLSVIEFSHPESSHKYLLKPSEFRRNRIIPATLFTRNTVDDILYSLLPESDTIYYSSPKENIPLKALYVLKSDGLILTKESYPQKGFSDEEYAGLIKANKYVFGIHSFYYAAGRLFLRLQGTLNHYLAIDTKTNQAIAFNTLVDRLNPTTPATSIQGAMQNCLFFVFRKSELSDHYKRSGITPSYESIRKVISDRSASDSMIIMIIHLKET